MRAAEIRTRVFADHARLRELGTEADCAAARARIGGPRWHGQLRDAAQRLAYALLTHIDFEDEHLLPLIGAGDAWAPERARQIAQEHEGQRAAARALVMLAEEGGLVELLEATCAVARDLTRDMRAEEEHQLRPEWFRDDAVSVECSG